MSHAKAIEKAGLLGVATTAALVVSSTSWRGVADFVFAGSAAPLRPAPAPAAPLEVAAIASNIGSVCGMAAVTGMAASAIVASSARRRLPGATAGRRRIRVAVLAGEDRRSTGAVAERPLLDQIVTGAVRAIEVAELKRVEAQSEAPSEANGGWSGEPREWADADSLTQRISSVSQAGPLAQLKQFIADRLAGDYDEQAIGALIDSKIASNRVMMFSFSSCPFCLRAKTLLQEEYGIELEVYECDLEPDGKAVRAELGRRTGRTSMPSTWLGPDVLLGGCNDGGLGGVATLHAEGALEALLAERGALSGGSPWWFPSFGPDLQEVSRQKRALRTLCADAPKNGVGTSEDLKDDIENAAKALEPSCQGQPARAKLEGVWDLLYCTAPGGSNGKVGPFVGDVTQVFVDDERFKNEVEVFGILKLSLEAQRKIMDDYKIKVTFKQLAVSIFGTEVFRKDLKGAGVWKQRYVDEDLRVMDTPSLFVLRRRL